MAQLAERLLPSPTAPALAAPALHHHKLQGRPHSCVSHRNAAAATPGREASTVEVCRYWLQGRCTRRYCRYAHPSTKQRAAARHHQQQPKLPRSQRCNLADHAGSAPAKATRDQSVPALAARLQNETWRRPSSTVAASSAQPCHHRHKPNMVSHTNAPRAATSDDATPPTAQRGLQLVNDHGICTTPGCAEKTAVPPGNDCCCMNVDAAAHVCKSSPEDSHGAAVFVNSLVGHDAAVSGIAFPHSLQMLFSVSDDATLRAWDSRTGLCCDVLSLANPASCLFNSFSDPSWLFLGLPDEVRVCDLVTHGQQSLAVSSPVLSLSSLGDLLVAGLQQGSILVWRFEAASASFRPLSCLSCTDVQDELYEKNRQTLNMASPVLSLERSMAPGSTIVYAGHADGMLRAWDLRSGRCLQALHAHERGVTQLLTCGHTSLLSASVDGTIKLWDIFASSDQHQFSLQGTFLPPQDQYSSAQTNTCSADGASAGGRPQPSAICGVFDDTDTPILFAAYSDAKVYMLEVPTFKCKGAIQTESVIQAMDTGPGSVLLLGSNKGGLSVWKWK